MAFSKLNLFMKTKFNPLIIAFVLSSILCRAQETQESSFLKHDIGFNTNFIIGDLFQSSETPFSIMYKRYTSPTKAIRIGMDLNFGSSDSKGQNSSPTNMYYDSKSIYVALVVGREWQNIISKRWMFYYGIDLVPS